LPDAKAAVMRVVDDLGFDPVEHRLTAGILKPLLCGARSPNTAPNRRLEQISQPQPASNFRNLWHSNTCFQSRRDFLPDAVCWTRVVLAKVCSSIRANLPKGSDAKSPV
jgi:hypothetical protein